MALRTEEELKQLFEISRLSQQRKKEKEKQRYKKASQDVKKALDRKQQREQKQSQPKPQKQVKITFSLSIYNSNLIEREAAEEDLYQTREQIMEAEERGEGKLNWDLFDRLVRETRQWYRKNHITL